MKDIKEIYEGILGDMDDTIARGEEDIEDFNYKEILSMFNIDKKSKYDDIISIIGEDNFLTTQMKKDISRDHVTGNIIL